MAGSGVSAAIEASSPAIERVGLLMLLMLSRLLVRSSASYSSSISSSSFSSSLNMLVFQIPGVGADVEVGDSTVDTSTFDADAEEDFGTCPLMGVSDWLRRSAPRLVGFTVVLPPVALPISRPVNCEILLIDRCLGTMDGRAGFTVSTPIGDCGGGNGEGIGDIIGDGTGVVTVMEGVPLAE